MFTWIILCVTLAETAEIPDISSVPPDLQVPAMRDGDPQAGKRIRQVTPGYERTQVYHALYLPTDWKPERRYPVLVEFAGNGGYRNKFGDVSTGKLEDSRMGYGISAGAEFIWVCLPYLNNAGDATLTNWWGDSPTYDVRPTLEYCRRTVQFICEKYGGDPAKVILCGFSRGAIACNYVGLHDDETAKLWRGFIVFSHYDGVVEKWPYPGADRESARRRLQRLAGRPQFICAESSSVAGASLAATEMYLAATGEKARFMFVSTGFRNHSDAWLLCPSPARTKLREWLTNVLREE
jgi:hypothetical protein